MTCGIITMQFNPNMSEDEIMMCVRKIYTENDACIAGMQYREFEVHEPVEKILKFIDEMED